MGAISSISVPPQVAAPLARAQGYTWTGSGKTLLRQALVASTNKQSVQSVVVSARGAGDAAGILRQVAQALDVAQAEVGAALEIARRLTAAAPASAEAQRDLTPEQAAARLRAQATRHYRLALAP